VTREIEAERHFLLEELLALHLGGDAVALVR
jgi:hypothetical protein